jgi:hypothetical protein
MPAAIDLRVSQKCVAPSARPQRRFQRDHRLDEVGTLGRQRQRDAGAHRAAQHHHRLADHLFDKARAPVEVGFLVELVAATGPALRRQRAAMPRHVESDQTPVGTECGIAHHAVKLSCIGAGGV